MPFEMSACPIEPEDPALSRNVPCICRSPIVELAIVVLAKVASPATVMLLLNNTSPLKTFKPLKVELEIVILPKLVGGTYGIEPPPLPPPL